MIEVSFDGVKFRARIGTAVLAEIDKEIQTRQEVLMPAKVRDTPPTVDVLIQVLVPLVEWQHWTRDQKNVNAAGRHCPGYPGCRLQSGVDRL